MNIWTRLKFWERQRAKDAATIKDLRLQVEKYFGEAEIERRNHLSWHAASLKYQRRADDAETALRSTREELAMVRSALDALRADARAAKTDERVGVR